MNNVLKELPNTGFAPSNAAIAKHLREQADWMEEADATPVRMVVMIIERMDGTLLHQTTGHVPNDLARVIGVMQMAIIRGAFGEE